MKYTPAIHIGFFGVFPDGLLDVDLIESLTGRRAALHANEVALATASDARRLSRIFYGQTNDNEKLEIESFQENQDMQDAIYSNAHTRMTSAYNFVARKGWLKPVMGAVMHTPTFSTIPQVPLIEQLETATLSAFYDLMHHKRTYSLGNVINSARGQLTGLAHIRCVVNGTAVPFISSNPEKTYLLKSTTAPHFTPDINPDIFDLASVDMLNFCRKIPDYRRSVHTGFTAPPTRLTWEP